jgi:hypothetical protein
MWIRGFEQTKPISVQDYDFKWLYTDKKRGNVPVPEDDEARLV